jgi:hypothetical protein
LWSSAAFAAEPAAPPAQVVNAARSAAPITAADGERRTALVGFQAVNHQAWLETNTRPDGTVSKDWYAVCVAPCTRRVATDGAFRAAGSDFAPSEPFHLPNKERIIVTSRLEANKRSRTAPIVMMATGFGSAVLLGPPVFLYGIVAALGGEPAGDALLATGLALVVGGAAAGLVGLIWLSAVSNNKQSSVSVASQSTPRLELPGGFALEPRGVTF